MNGLFGVPVRGRGGIWGGRRLESLSAPPIAAGGWGCSLFSTIRYPFDDDVDKICDRGFAPMLLKFLLVNFYFHFRYKIFGDRRVVVSRVAMALCRHQVMVEIILTFRRYNCFFVREFHRSLHYFKIRYEVYAYSPGVTWVTVQDNL